MGKKKAQRLKVEEALNEYRTQLNKLREIQMKYVTEVVANITDEDCAEDERFAFIRQTAEDFDEERHRNPIDFISI